MIEPVPVLGAGFLRNRPFGSGIAQRRSINQKYIEASIVVVVEEGHSRTHRLKQVLPGGVRRAILKVDAQPRGDIDKRLSRSGSGCHRRGTLLRNCKRWPAKRQTANGGEETNVVGMRIAIDWPIHPHGSTIPLPSTTVKIRSTDGIRICSFVPLGHWISTLSTLVAVPKPKCRRGSELEA